MDSNIDLGQLVRNRHKLIGSLVEAQTDEGWTDPSLDKEQDPWTSANVAAALILSGFVDYRVWKVVNSFRERFAELTGYGGFLAEGNRLQASVALTSDVAWLGHLVGEYELRDASIDALVRSQHDDGSWGLSREDPVGRVRPTAQALMALVRCVDHPGLDLREPEVVGAVRWLVDSRVTGGTLWSNVGGESSLSLSATAWAVASLSEYLKIRPGTRQVSECLERACQPILALGAEVRWNGVREDVAIVGPDGQTERLGSGAVGLTLLAPAGMSLCVSGVWQDTPNAGALLVRELLSRVEISNDCARYSEDGTSQFTWNIAFVIGSISSLIKLVSELTPPDHHSHREHRATRHIVPWLGWSIVFVLLARWGLDRLSWLPDWYGESSPFLQGLIMLILGVAVNEMRTPVVDLARRMRNNSDRKRSQ